MQSQSHKLVANDCKVQLNNLYELRDDYKNRLDNSLLEVLELICNGMPIVSGKFISERSILTNFFNLYLQFISPLFLTYRNSPLLTNPDFAGAR